jgi:hypothetical protein
VRHGTKLVSFASCWGGKGQLCWCWVCKAKHKCETHLRMERECYSHCKSTPDLLLLCCGWAQICYSRVSVRKETYSSEGSLVVVTVLRTHPI